MPTESTRPSVSQPPAPPTEVFEEQAPRETSCWGCDTVGQYWAVAKDSARNLVDSNPILAMITAVVFAIFGISQILPTVVSAIIIAVPLCSFAYMIAQDILLNREAFTQRLLMQLASTSDIKTPVIEMGRRAVQDSKGRGASPDEVEDSPVEVAHEPLPMDPKVAAYLAQRSLVFKAPSEGRA